MNEAELPSEFRALLRPPVVAWPTILLFLACLSGLVGVAVLGLSEQIPLAVGALINGLLVAAAYAGFFLEALMLWIVPTRISSFPFVAMFVYLPHAPFTHTAQQDEYRASNIRAGWEWLLTPLMTFQNYHLVHHLYPRAPFYRMLTIWNGRLSEHLARDPFFVKTFGITSR